MDTVYISLQITDDYTDDYCLQSYRIVWNPSPLPVAESKHLPKTYNGLPLVRSKSRIRTILMPEAKEMCDALSLAQIQLL